MLVPEVDSWVFLILPSLLIRSCYAVILTSTVHLVRLRVSGFKAGLVDLAERCRPDAGFSWRRLAWPSPRLSRLRARSCLRPVRTLCACVVRRCPDHLSRASAFPLREPRRGQGGKL